MRGLLTALLMSGMLAPCLAQIPTCYRIGAGEVDGAEVSACICRTHPAFWVRLTAACGRGMTVERV